MLKWGHLIFLVFGGVIAKPQGLDDLAVVVSASAKSEAVPQEGRNYFPIDESGDDEAGFRLPRLIQDQEKGEDLGAVIVQSSPPGGRDLEDNLKPTGFSFPQDHSAPNKAGFRLPPAASGRGSEDLEVFIVEGQVEDEEEEEDAFIVVAAPSNPAEDNDDFVVIVGSEDPGASREPKILEPLRRPSQVDCGAPLDRGICQARSVEPESEAFYYDARENKCVLFIYSGCGGNSNRFSSIEDCELQCRVEDPQPRALDETLDSLDLDPSVCSQPGGKPGICKGAFQYFYYKEESGTCEPFIFGGCEAGSSDNKFPNIELCQRTCIDRASTDNILLY